MGEEERHFRTHTREATLFLAAMLEQKSLSRHPEDFDKAIKTQRRKVLGQYTKLLNMQKSVDNSTQPPRMSYNA